MLIFDPHTCGVQVEPLWLPHYREDKQVVEALTSFGIVQSVTREKRWCAGMAYMDTLKKNVHLTLHEGLGASMISHLLELSTCECHVLGPGRPPLSSL